MIYYSDKPVKNQLLAVRIEIIFSFSRFSELNFLTPSPCPQSWQQHQLQSSLISAGPQKSVVFLRRSTRAFSPLLFISHPGFHDSARKWPREEQEEEEEEVRQLKIRARSKLPSQRASHQRNEFTRFLIFLRARSCVLISFIRKAYQYVRTCTQCRLLLDRVVKIKQD